MTDTVVGNIMSGLSPRFHIRVHINLDPAQIFRTIARSIVMGVFYVDEQQWS